MGLKSEITQKDADLCAPADTECQEEKEEERRRGGEEEEAKEDCTREAVDHQVLREVCVLPYAWNGRTAELSETKGKLHHQNNYLNHDIILLNIYFPYNMIIVAIINDH